MLSATCPRTGNTFTVDPTQAQDTHAAAGVVWLWLQCPCCGADGHEPQPDVPHQWWVFIVRPGGRLVPVSEEAPVC